MYNIMYEMKKKKELVGKKLKKNVWDGGSL